MHLYYRNVNDAFTGVVSGFLSGQFPTTLPGGTKFIYTPPFQRVPTRDGDALQICEPVTITYSHPQERVLYNPYRDANPFFHMVEALWILAGRNDIAPLVYYNKQAARYSDDGKTWHGAYGHRLRHPIDQITLAIDILGKQRTTRRCVLETWRPTDLLRVAEMPHCLDVPCNTQIILSRCTTPGAGWGSSTGIGRAGEFLDMTVFNRSNDTIWGALGSNYVHFTFLQEYIAAHIGAVPGVYNQISNNLHCYVDEGTAPKRDFFTNKLSDVLVTNRWTSEDPYGDFQLLTTQQLDVYLESLFAVAPERHYQVASNNYYIQDTVQPMLAAWYFHKQKDYNAAIIYASRIKSPDWRAACQAWLRRRQERFDRAHSDGVQHDG